MPSATTEDIETSTEKTHEAVSSPMASTLFFLLFSIFFDLHFHFSTSQSWIKAGYWYVGSLSPIPDINSALFSHLICAFATVNPSTYELSIAKSDEQYFSTFTSILKRKNPSIVTLISGGTDNLKLHRVFWERRRTNRFSLRCSGTILLENLSFSPRCKQLGDMGFRALTCFGFGLKQNQI